MSDAPLEPPSSALASLLAAERGDTLSDHDGERAVADLEGARERVLARLAATLGPLDLPPPPAAAPPAPVVPPAAPIPTPASTAPAGLAGLLTKTSLGMLFAGLVLGSATTAAWLPRGTADVSGVQPSGITGPVASSAANVAQAIQETKPASSGALEPPPGAPVGRDGPPGTHVAPAVASSPKAAAATRAEDGRDPDLERERTLLDVARGALARQNGALALSSLDEHARRFPNGRLAEEREALRVRSLEIAGRTEEAKRRREAFSSAYPDSFALPPPSASPPKEPRKEKTWPE